MSQSNIVLAFDVAVVFFFFFVLNDTHAIDVLLLAAKSVAKAIADLACTFIVFLVIVAFRLCLLLLLVFWF